MKTVRLPSSNDQLEMIWISDITSVRSTIESSKDSNIWKNKMDFMMPPLKC